MKVSADSFFAPAIMSHLHFPLSTTHPPPPPPAAIRLETETLVTRCRQFPGAALTPRPLSLHARPHLRHRRLRCCTLVPSVVLTPRALPPRRVQPMPPEAQKPAPKQLEPVEQFLCFFHKRQSLMAALGGSPVLPFPPASPQMSEVALGSIIEPRSSAVSRHTMSA